MPAAAETAESPAPVAKRPKLPPLEAGRQVGWIFRDGVAVAIERQEVEGIPGPAED